MVLTGVPGQSHVRKELVGIGLHTGTMFMRRGGRNHYEQFTACSQITGSLWRGGLMRFWERWAELFPYWLLHLTLLCFLSSSPALTSNNGAQGSVLGPLPFSTPIFYELTHSHGFKHHPYSDDSLVSVFSACPEVSRLGHSVARRPSLPKSLTNIRILWVLKLPGVLFQVYSSSNSPLLVHCLPDSQAKNLGVITSTPPLLTTTNNY